MKRKLQHIKDRGPIKYLVTFPKEAIQMLGWQDVDYLWFEIDFEKQMVRVRKLNDVKGDD